MEIYTIVIDLEKNAVSFGRRRFERNGCGA
jgi:hypothetical protein